MFLFLKAPDRQAGMRGFQGGSHAPHSENTDYELWKQLRLWTMEPTGSEAKSVSSLFLQKSLQKRQFLSTPKLPSARSRTNLCPVEDHPGCCHTEISRMHCESKWGTYKVRYFWCKKEEYVCAYRQLCVHSLIPSRRNQVNQKPVKIIEGKNRAGKDPSLNRPYFIILTLN